MADEQKPTTEYRARPIPEVTVTEKMQTLQPEQRVVVEVKNWKQSYTVLINGALLIAATVLQVADILFGAHILEPLVGVFVKDPTQATHVITVLTQAYTLLNLYLRAKTNAPITLRSDKKE